MAGERCIGPRPQIGAPGDKGVAANHAGWPHTLLSGAVAVKLARQWSPQQISRWHFRAILRCRCRLRRFTEACLSRVAVCSSEPCSGSSAANATFGTHVAALASALAKDRS